MTTFSTDDLVRIKTYLDNGENIDHDDIRSLIANLDESWRERDEAREALKAEIAFYESQDEMGPLYCYWKDGEIGNWDDGEWDWERTLNACRNDVDCPTVEYLATGIVNVWPAIERYRAMRKALAATEELP